MSSVDTPPLVAAQAFDRVATKYDQQFTNSLLGRLQRQAVWDTLLKAFEPGHSVLELNCGTGEDALFLVNHGVNVIACDASPRMIEIARKKAAQRHNGAPIRFEVLPNERLDSLQVAAQFDGVLSNFSGLNCVVDLSQVARHLGRLIKPRGRALACMSTRVCLWEILWFLCRGNPHKAFRRLSGKTVANIEEIPLPVRYPSKRSVCKAFSPWFLLRKVKAVGLFIPPSYVEDWSARHTRTLAALELLDRLSRNLPVVAQFGDHVLFEFERTDQ
jgi:ubiquinone/menaquinone biosynthesis C-methylase UbiE